MSRNKYHGGSLRSVASKSNSSIWKTNFNLNEHIEVQFIPSLGVNSKLIFKVSD